jgi:hypothetical protein
MKQLKKDLQALSRELRALKRKTEKIAAAVKKLEKAEASGWRGREPILSKTAQAPDKLTAIDHLMDVVKRSKKGLDIPALVEKTGFEDQKVRNILARAFKQGRVARVGRGCYVAQEDRRRHSRISSLNLVSYTCMDKDNQVVRQAMGRTLDVTEGGILLETHLPMDAQHRVSLTIGVKEDLVDVEGRVVHCRPAKAGRFQSGIQFAKMNKASLRILKRFIAAFKDQQGGN